MVKMSVEYLGRLKCKATHKDLGATLTTDAPKEIGGAGETFSPTDLFACSLATCIATTIGLYAERKGLDLKGMQLEMEKIMTDQPSRRIGQIKIEIQISGSFSNEEKQALERVAHSCPVHKSLNPDVKVDLIINFSP